MPAPIISACHLGLGIVIFKTITQQSQYYWSLHSTTGSLHLPSLEEPSHQTDLTTLWWPTWTFFIIIIFPGGKCTLEALLMFSFMSTSLYRPTCLTTAAI